MYEPWNNAFAIYVRKLAWRVLEVYHNIKFTLISLSAIKVAVGFKGRCLQCQVCTKKNLFRSRKWKRQELGKFVLSTVAAWTPVSILPTWKVTWGQIYNKKTDKKLMPAQEMFFVSSTATGFAGGRFEVKPQILDTWAVNKGQSPA